MRVLKLLAGLLIGLLAFIATGCKMPVNVGAYGVVPPAHDPTVVLTSFSYTPAEAIRVGDRLVFTAVINKPVVLEGGSVSVFSGNPPAHQSDFLVMLNDYGFPPDVTRADGVWTGEYIWPDTLGPQTGLPVFAHLGWWDGFSGGTLQAPPLTVLAAEEED